MKIGRLTYGIDCIIVKSNTANDIELAVSNVRNSLTRRSSKEIDSILNAIHMHAKGKMELGADKSERFIKFWIALEALINLDGNDKYIAKRIETALIRLYESKNPGKKCGMKAGYEIVEIKKDRTELFHYAIENPERVTQLEYILDDLINSELGLPFRGHARKYIDTI